MPSLTLRKPSFPVFGQNPEVILFGLRKASDVLMGHLRTGEAVHRLFSPQNASRRVEAVAGGSPFKWRAAPLEVCPWDPPPRQERYCLVERLDWPLPKKYSHKQSGSFHCLEMPSVSSSALWLEGAAVQ